MPLEPIVIKINEDGTTTQRPRLGNGRTPTTQPIKKPEPVPLCAPPMVPASVTLPFIAQMSAAMFRETAELEAKRLTQSELDKARTVPENSPGLTLAEQRRRFERAQVGPSLLPLEVDDQSLFIKRLNFGEILYLTLLLPIGETGFLDSLRPEELAFAVAEMLRLGLCKNGDGEGFFENRGDAVAYIDDDSTADFASVAVMAIDDLNRIFPRRPEAPQPTRAQQRLERLKAKHAAAGGDKKPRGQSAAEQIKAQLESA